MPQEIEMDEVKIQAMLQELAIGRNLSNNVLGDRCANLAGELALRDQRISSLMQQVEKQASEIAELKEQKREAKP